MSNYSALICPECGAPVKPEHNGDFYFCEHCDCYFKEKQLKQKIEVSINENVTVKEEKVIRTIDEAKVLRQQNIASMKKNTRHGIKSILKFLGIFYLAVILLAFIGMGIADFQEKRNEKEAISLGKIPIQGASYSYKGQNYKIIEKEIEAKGFTNIELLPIETVDEDTKKDCIIAVSVGGDSSFGYSDYYYPDDKVIISYRINE